MNRDLRTRVDSDSLDDATIQGLVRDAASAWTMPAVRLDAPSWRERVRSPRARRVAATRGWFGRIGQAATAALVLTVAGALVAAMITRAPRGAGSSPAPSTNASPDPTGAAAASPLPKLLVAGNLPSPVDLLVRTEQGDFATVDLRSGSIGGPLTGARYGSDLRVRADGSMVCLCFSETGSVGDTPTEASVSLERYDPSGKLISSTAIDSFAGEPDPRDVGTFIPDQPAHVLTELSYSADGRYGFVGWSARAHPAWKNGIVVVDLQDGSVVSRLELADGSTGGGDSRRVVVAPRVIGSAGSDGLLIARAWYEWSPPASENARYSFGSDVFRVRFSGGQWSGLEPLTTAGTCGDYVLRGGALADGGAWLACSRDGSTSTTIRRLAADGTQLGDSSVPGPGGIDGDLTVLSPDGMSVFAWNPSSATLTKVDLATGKTRTGHGPTARVESDPLAAFGAWLAPTAAAKSLLRGAIVVSPDGSRVYAIGIKASGDEREPSGSTGVFVFDATTLEDVGHYPATADFVSLALSRDGQFLYAAGMPGVDASGRPRRTQAASITVFSTADGNVRLVAGQLGSGLITFNSPTLD